MNEDKRKIRDNFLLVLACMVFIGIYIVQAALSRKFQGNGINGVLMQGQVLISVLLAVFLKKKGFIASISLNILYALVTLMKVIMVDKNTSSIPGVASPLITIITCCIIYTYSQKIATANGALSEKNRELTEINKVIREKDEKLIYLAYYDVLTGLANRQLFVEQIDEMIGNNSNNFNVVIADIDDFKRIIDAYGHNIGDIVISTYADRLRSYCGQTGFIAKFGEEEFAIIIKNTDDMDIDEYVDKLRMALFAPVVASNDTPPIQLTMSFGVTEYPAAGKTSSEILRNTDIAVTNAKMTGRGRICFLNQNKYL